MTRMNFQHILLHPCTLLLNANWHHLGDGAGFHSQECPLLSQILQHQGAQRLLKAFSWRVCLRKTCYFQEHQQFTSKNTRTEEQRLSDSPQPPPTAARALPPSSKAPRAVGSQGSVSGVCRQAEECRRVINVDVNYIPPLNPPVQNLQEDQMSLNYFI